jgi:hypothetical protein
MIGALHHKGASTKYSLVSTQYTLACSAITLKCKTRVGLFLTVRNTLAYYYVTGENTLAFCVNVSDEEKSLKH